jgi:hypothetical protein
MCICKLLVAPYFVALNFTFFEGVAERVGASLYVKYGSPLSHVLSLGIGNPVAIFLCCQRVGATL